MDVKESTKNKVQENQILLESIPLLLEWYDTHKRDLPWRKDKDAYHIWISEIMLQQTRVEAVIEYYNHFIREVPDLKTLSRISEDYLLKLWQGLGYYSRARNLQKTAQLLIEQGKTTLPSTYAELLKLPGIGTYTAGAIASIAYGETVPAVDGNVLRILTRILGQYDNIADSKTKTKYENLLKPYMPENESGNLNQAMMELGATICIPNGAPRCNICPVSAFCQAYQKGLLAVLPVKIKKQNRKIISKIVFLYIYKNQIAIQKRPDYGLLASLYEFPNIDSSMNLNEVKSYLNQENIAYESVSLLGKYKHIFTHLEWNMDGYIIFLRKKIRNRYIWATVEELNAIYSLPSAFTKLLKDI